jgi:hypothetical protein
LIVDFALQFHECVKQRFRTRRAPGDVNVDWNVTVDAFKNIVTLFKRSTGNRARAHCDHVFWISHLVIKAHDLWRHLLRDRSGDDHQIRLPR